jgi:polysaccharide deacetylase family protein (PEP-CTERM system associated)
MKPTIVNAMTIDVEDYFQVSAFEHVIRPADWDGIAPRVEANTQRLLDMFEQHNVTATFFILGWVAERFPELIKKMAAAGHEIASHGYMHQRATAQTAEQFKQDVESTRKLLQDLTGAAVVGYRAPSFSIDRSNEWAYDVLAEAGYQYSSSVYPVAHDHYGIPDAPRFKYQTPQGVWEIPLTTLLMGSKNIPISGGGYFRLYPYRFTAWAVNRFHSKDNQPYIFYMHPWEIDPEQPRQQGLSFKSRFRHYLNLSRVSNRLDNLLRDFEWSSLEQVYFAETPQSEVKL